MTGTAPSSSSAPHPSLCFIDIFLKDGNGLSEGGRASSLEPSLSSLSSEPLPLVNV